jgi:hypothetical protein
MKTLFLTLLLATLCAAGYGQTIKALGYNTNGIVIGPTNALTFTNSITKQGEAEFGAGNAVLFFYDLDGNKDIFFFDGGENDEARARQNLGLGWPALTNTNAATSLLGINASNEVVAATNIIFTNGVAFTTNAAAATLANLGLGTNASVTISNLNAQSVSITNADTFRSDLGIPLPALTNTNNADTMRALAGSTNTNEPFSGTLSWQDFNDDTVSIVVSNGIILSVSEP